MKFLPFSESNMFRFKSVFFTILISMISLSLVICVLVSVIFINLVSKKNFENLNNSNRTHVESVASNTEYYFLQLQQSQIQLSFSGNINYLAVTQERDDKYVNASMIDLSIMADNNTLVKDIYIYYPDIDVIVSSDFTEYTYSSFPLEDMLAAYESGHVDKVDIESIGRRSALFYYDGTLYLVCDFFLQGESKLGSIIYVIDSQEIARRLKNDLPSSSDIYIFDGYDQPIFQRYINYPDGYTPASLSSSDGTDSRNNSEPESIFVHHSKLLGWYFIYEIRDQSNSLSWKDISPIILPIILIVIPSAIILSLIISRILYRPFGDLMKQVGDEAISDTPSTLKNEVDYLNYAFAEMAGRHTEMSSMLSKVSDDVMSRTFLNLIHGIQMSNSTVADILKSSKSSFNLNDSYVVCYINSPDLTGVSESQRGGIIGSITRVVNTFASDNSALSHVLPIDSEAVAVILSFADSDYLMQIKRSLAGLKNDLDQLFSEKNMRVSIGFGKIYHSMLDLGLSYHEAVKDTSVPDDTADQPDSPETEELGSDIKARAAQLVDLIKAGDTDSAEVLKDRIIHEAAADTDSVNELKEYYDSFISSLSDRISAFEYLTPDLFDNDDLLVFRSREFNDKSELEETALSVVGKLISGLSKMLRNQNNPLLVEAQQYISENYSDCMLSLGAVADHIGVSQSYLSKLFKNNLGIHFTDYLNSVRIERSEELIINTDLTLNEIAVRTGFNSPQSFIRVFKQINGKTPGKFRSSLSQ
ncbi:MAG: helix-turn-helix domain-containing protein [Oscillospiraceae bacterium]|nr:helix-turn-helix domain-containing protein [Oscillospiraceae bacterium]